MSTSTDPTERFAAMQDALRAAAHCQPVVVVDRERLDRNLDQLAATVPAGFGVRIVAKSLPSIDLLRYVMERLDTDRLMTFNLPMLRTLAAVLPDVDQLCGKPFPVAAADRFYDMPGASTARVQWLVDTPDRLAQYEELATRRGLRLRVSFELDIGLHRGGFAPGAVLRSALERVGSGELDFAGFMGYEAHVAKFPAGRLRDRVFARALDTYRDAIDIARRVHGDDAIDSAILNAAGSPTYALHDGAGPANEISIGSALLKGTDFDTDLLGAFQPAVYIAAPVLKVLDAPQVPGLPADGRRFGRRRARSRRAVFIHGGHWLAGPVHPPGLRHSRLFGRSSNQEMFTLTGDAPLEPDDFVFLRPTQTEAVLLQFGDIAVFDAGSIVEHWPAMPASA